MGHCPPFSPSLRIGHVLDDIVMAVVPIVDPLPALMGWLPRGRELYAPIPGVGSPDLCYGRNFIGASFRK